MKAKEIITYSSNLDTLGDSIKKLLKYTSLIWVFAKRDLRVKYAQTSLGIGWSIFKPLLGLIIYVSFFGLLLNWNSGKIPYPMYVLSGLVGWNLFLYIVVLCVCIIYYYHYCMVIGSFKFVTVCGF